MIFGIVRVMEIDMVAKELTADWMVAELVMHQRLRKSYVLDLLFNARGSSHAPDSFAAPSGTSTNSYDRRHYASRRAGGLAQLGDATTKTDLPVSSFAGP